MLREQMIEMMPELAEIGGWPNYGIVGPSDHQGRLPKTRSMSNTLVSIDYEQFVSNQQLTPLYSFLFLEVSKRFITKGQQKCWPFLFLFGGQTPNGNLAFLFLCNRFYKSVHPSVR